jgi:ferritin-like protein
MSNKEKTTVSAITGKQGISFEAIFAGLSMLVLAVMLTTAYTYYNNTQTILGLSEEIIAQINQRVFEDSKNYLMTAVDMTELSSKVTRQASLR